MEVARHVEGICGLCRICRGAHQRSREPYLYDQRVLQACSVGSWQRHRRARAQLVSTRIESGSSSRGAGAWPCGAGCPGARAGWNKGRAGREYRDLHSRHRDPGQHPRGGDRHARTQRRLPDRDSGRKIYRRLPGLCRRRCPEIYRRRPQHHFIADRFRRAQRVHAQPLCGGGRKRQ